MGCPLSYNKAGCNALFMNFLCLNAGAEEKTHQRHGSQALQEEMGPYSLLNAREFPGPVPFVSSAGRFAFLLIGSLFILEVCFIQIL